MPHGCRHAVPVVVKLGVEVLDFNLLEVDELGQRRGAGVFLAGREDVEIGFAVAVDVEVGGGIVEQHLVDDDFVFFQESDEVDANGEGADLCNSVVGRALHGVEQEDVLYFEACIGEGGKEGEVDVAE